MDKPVRNRRVGINVNTKVENTTTTFVVWGDTPNQVLNSCKMVQKHIKSTHSIDVDVKDMFVEVSGQDDDRLEVTVPLSIPSKWLDSTPESRYEHSKRFWYSNVMLNDLLGTNLEYYYSECDGDRGVISNHRTFQRDVSEEFKKLFK